MDAQTYLCQRRIVVALEGIEVVGAHLCRAVAAPEIVLEEYGHLLNHRACAVSGGGNLYGRNQVLLAVGANLADGELRAGDYHRFGQIDEHERQGRGRVGHGVCAVEHDKSVIHVIVLFDGAGNLLPVGRIHVARVDWRIELYVVYLVIEFAYARHVLNQMVEVEGNQRVGLRIFNHADCASGIDYQYPRFHGRCGRKVMSSRGSGCVLRIVFDGLFDL